MGGLFIELWCMKKWIVYVHIFPNGKLYFGITSKKPNARWENGNGYSDNQPVMVGIILNIRYYLRGCLIKRRLRKRWS